MGLALLARVLAELLLVAGRRATQVLLGPHHALGQQLAQIARLLLLHQLHLLVLLSASGGYVRQCGVQERLLLLVLVQIGWFRWRGAQYLGVIVVHHHGGSLLIGHLLLSTDVLVAGRHGPIQKGVEGTRAILLGSSSSTAVIWLLMVPVVEELHSCAILLLFDRAGPGGQRLHIFVCDGGGIGDCGVVGGVSSGVIAAEHHHHR